VDLTEQDAFCTIQDVEALVGRGSFGGATVPSSQQVIDVMGTRAAALEVAIASAGVPKTVPSGTSPLLETGSDARLYRLCRQANAYYAAGDAMLMNQTRDAINVPEKVKAYFAIAEDIVASIRSAKLADATGQDIDRSWVTNSSHDADEDDLVGTDMVF
jgi:hypothetical protein